MERPSIRRSVVAASLAVAMIVGTVVLARAEEERGENNREEASRHDSRYGKEKHQKWMAGDFHNHTTYTDGSWPMNDLTGPATIIGSAVPSTTGLYKQGTAPTGFRNGLDFFTNSEHGGIRARDGFGSNWTDMTAYPTPPAVGDPTRGQMWRWQSLINPSDIPGYSGSWYLGAYDWIDGIRANWPDKIVMTGMEWNVPGHEHASTAIVAGDALPIAEFEYRFDNSDTDGATTTTTAATMGWPGKIQKSSYVAPAYPDYSVVLGLNALHNKTIDGIKWMQAHYPKTGYIIPAHVERAGCGVGGYSIAAFRDMNDNGPTVAFGFEGLPGHDKASNRGELGASACGGGTYGGAGIYIAQVGGLWDSLLADGRRFYNFDSSDFHDTPNDFWPGEYEKTYVKVNGSGHDGSYTQEDVINGLRSGNAFSVHGDLINALDFQVFSGAPFGGGSATMGEILSVERGEKVTVRIRFKSPAANFCMPGVNASAGYVCAPPVVHHVQLIQGRVNPAKAKKFLADGVTPNPAYNSIDSSAAAIVKTFDASSWRIDEEGFTTMHFVVPRVRNDMFFRIRGTNLPYDEVRYDATGTKIVYGTDTAGSPLLNTPGTNNADMPWSDLWFYSNPIFVKALGRD
ncbi:MAG: hypothetical protein PHP88_03175 [bacterium]|nr:hypothetical protein [bacterium]